MNKGLQTLRTLEWMHFNYFFSRKTHIFNLDIIEIQRTNDTHKNIQSTVRLVCNFN